MWKIIVFLIVISYFTYHIMSGQRGMLSLIDVNKQISEKQDVLNKLKEARIALERKIAGLSIGNYDRDLLNELARKKFFVADIDEKVIIIEDLK